LAVPIDLKGHLYNS